MSEHATAAGHPPAEEDRIQSWTIVAVGVGSLLVFLVAAAVTVAFFHREQAALNPAWSAAPSQAGQRKVGLVEQQLFENANRAASLQEEKRKRLDSYGWVDRKQGTVHIPIDRAIDLTLQGDRP